VCGIVGFSRDPGRPLAEDAAIIRTMLLPIAHRGPDGEGVHVAGPIAFGHLRLAIIDLNGGRQPRVDPETGDALVFNGEIYGYAALAAELAANGVTLEDDSDTEVLFRLLQRGGIEKTLETIDGMFAFAFYEGATRRLYLARDRFGEKPLYYLEREGTFVFGSEPAAVLSHPVSRSLPVDLGAVATYLAFEYLPGPRSLRAGLRKLPPGHYLVHTPEGTHVTPYWRPDPDERGSAQANASETEKLDRLDALMDDGVRARLVADVPVGVFLSGGIDSSLVAAYVARHAPGLTAFTVKMPEASYDETPAAVALARALGLAHEIIPLDETALLAAFAAVTARMDEPFADASLLPTWALARATRERVTVALGGDGADELFAGYISFKANRAARALALLPPGLGKLMRSLLARLPQKSSYMSADFLLRQLSQGFGVEPARQWAACMAPFADEELDLLWVPEARREAAATSDDIIGKLIGARGGRSWSTAELIHLFSRTYLPDDILHKVDRASMYVSLEVRAPYLGRSFAEYAMSLPSRDKIRGLQAKYLFRKLALKHLPREIVERPKHGFAVPLARMLRGPLKAPVGEAILGAASPLGDWFRRETIERLWREHQSGSRDHRKKIWTLFCLATAVENTRIDQTVASTAQLR
jgi:asparagine synthase (glutamine-hydrolysing)